MALYLLTIILVMMNIVPSWQVESLESITNVIEKLMEKTSKENAVSVNNVTELGNNSNIYYVHPFKDNGNKYDGDPEFPVQSYSRRGTEDEIDNILNRIQKENGALKEVIIEVEKTKPESKQASPNSKENENNESKAVKLLHELFLRRPVKTDFKPLHPQRGQNYHDPHFNRLLGHDGTSERFPDFGIQEDPLMDTNANIPKQHQKISKMATESNEIPELATKKDSRKAAQSLVNPDHQPITTIMRAPVIHGMLARQTLLGSQTYYPTLQPSIHRYYVPYAQSNLHLVNNYPLYNEVLRPSLNNFNRFNYINHMINGAITKFIYTRYK